MTGMGLTEQQSNLLGFIIAWQAEHGFSPNFPEMATHLGLSKKSKGAVHRHLKCLEERGYIRRLAKRSRSIEICDPDAPICPHCFNRFGSAQCYAAAEDERAAQALREFRNSLAAKRSEAPDGIPPAPSAAIRGPLTQHRVT